jgi:2-polyprenyl-6-methoxyphenol hydroxylase-like FAD-dependent oxidoreductase
LGCQGKSILPVDAYYVIVVKAPLIRLLPDPQIKETSKTKPPKEDLRCNVLIGADGQNSNVAKLFEFDRKLFKGSEAIGITANFVNNQSREEIALDEFGLMSIYNKPVSTSCFSLMRVWLTDPFPVLCSSARSARH